MRNFIFVAILCVLACAPTYSQENIKTQSDGWSGLTLDVSTVDDAVSKLGKPAKDETNKNVVVSRDAADWLKTSKESKIFRKLTFDKPEGFAKARLYFKDNILAIIELEPKYGWEEGWLDPDNLSSIVSADFKPHNVKVFGGSKLPPPGNFAVSGDATTKDLWPLYEMIAVTDKSFVFARVDNVEPFSVFRGNSNSKEKEKRDKGGEFPGHVTMLQIISRSFEKETPK